MHKRISVVSSQDTDDEESKAIPMDFHFLFYAVIHQLRNHNFQNISKNAMAMRREFCNAIRYRRLEFIQNEIIMQNFIRNSVW